jgi:type I restriction enzyme R subunit
MLEIVYTSKMKRDVKLMSKRGKDIIKNFICFSGETKILGAYHQYFAVRKVVASTANAIKGIPEKSETFWGEESQRSGRMPRACEGLSERGWARRDGKGGVFWHTQGSGKSLSVVFYARFLQEALHLSTIVVLTDRNDLDDQLVGQFAKCSDFLRQVPVQATCRSLSEDYKERHRRNPDLKETEVGLHDDLHIRGCRHPEFEASLGD